MIPDNVEKIVMTKQDYDRNVEQLLFDKVKAEQELDKYKNIIDKIRNLSNQVKEEAKEVENEWCYQVMKEIDYLLKEGDDK